MDQKVIDYIINQADRYDITNMQFEQDILLSIRTLTDNNVSKILRVVTPINNSVDLSMLLISITSIFEQYVNSIKKLLLDKFSKYYDTAYNNTDDLIQIGKEVSGRLSESVREQRNTNEYDEDTIEFIQQHAFELLTGYSQQKINQIRAKLGDMLLSGKSSKAQVRDMIEKTLNTNRSKAEEIAQQELSRAYNHGTLSKLHEYSRLTGEKTKKYWHGFKYSKVTCDYCRPRIGNVYDLDDETESLPAHIRCRCVWLPILESWDKPINTSLISRANMLNTAYSKEMMYLRIQNRLNIKYADYIDEDAVIDYLSGDRSQKVISAISNARQSYINDIKDSLDIAPDTTNSRMSKEFNTQLSFWKNIIAEAKADNDNDLLNRSIEAIKGVMILPWNSEQMSKWNDLISRI